MLGEACNQYYAQSAAKQEAANTIVCCRGLHFQFNMASSLWLRMVASTSQLMISEHHSVAYR